MSSHIQRRPDEGPSPEDIRKFSHELAHCPDCGAEIWDQADVCPKCFAYLAGHTSSRHPSEAWFRKRWVVAVAIIVMIAFVMLLTPGGTQLLRIILPASP
jgi:hypothetical protein